MPSPDGSRRRTLDEVLGSLWTDEKSPVQPSYTDKVENTRFWSVGRCNPPEDTYKKSDFDARRV